MGITGMIQEKWTSFLVVRNKKSWLLRVFKDLEYKWGLWEWIRRIKLNLEVVWLLIYTTPGQGAGWRIVAGFYPLNAGPQRCLLNFELWLIPPPARCLVALPQSRKNRKNWTVCPHHQLSFKKNKKEDQRSAKFLAYLWNGDRQHLIFNKWSVQG